MFCSTLSSVTLEPETGIITLSDLFFFKVSQNIVPLMKCSCIIRKRILMKTNGMLRLCTYLNETPEKIQHADFKIVKYSQVESS